MTSTVNGQGVSASINSDINGNFAIYTAMKGDDTWSLSEKFYGEGQLWSQIVTDNPFLNDDDRIWVDKGNGKIICLLLPGEQILIKKSMMTWQGFLEIDTISESTPSLPKQLALVDSSDNWYVDPIYDYEFWQILCLILIIILFLISLFTAIKQASKKRLNADPITAGPPQVPGGVNDGGAYTRMNALAGNKYRNQPFNIKNIRRGTLSGLADIHYADKSTKKINLQNVLGYAGDIMVGGKEETIYFLQGCGNDARSGNYMRGEEISFTPHAEILEDGTATPIDSSAINLSSQSSATELEKPKTEEGSSEVPVTEESPVAKTGTEFHQETEKFFQVVEKFIDKNGETHKMSMKITDENRSCEFIVEPRFDNKKSTAPK